MSDAQQASELPDRATPDRILDALVDVILEGGLVGFSVQEVADRAGLSHRTVYRHFETREALLNGLDAAIGARMLADGGISHLDTLDEMPSAILTNYALFSKDSKAMEASVRFGVGSALVQPDREQRSQMIREVVERDIPELDPGDAEISGVVLRTVISSRVWLGFLEAGLDAESAARAAAWMASVLIDALRAGRTPLREPLPAVNGNGEHH